jgi:hypothetical protein
MQEAERSIPHSLLSETGLLLRLCSNSVIYGRSKFRGSAGLRVLNGLLIVDDREMSSSGLVGILPKVTENPEKAVSCDECIKMDNRNSADETVLSFS